VNAARAVLARELTLALRSGGGAGLGLAFFLIVVLLVPLGVGPEPDRLAGLAAGTLWIGALLACLLSLDRLFQADHEDGTLDNLALATLPLEGPVALKATPQRPSEIQTALPASLPVTGRAADEPWLRAIIATPSVRAYMTITLLGANDMRALQPLLRKPSAMLLAMTFSTDPYAGLNHQRFQGSAVVFLASAMSGGRTALQ